MLYLHHDWSRRLVISCCLMLGQLIGALTSCLGHQAQSCVTHFAQAVVAVLVSQVKC